MRGQSLGEYAIILAFIALVVVVALIALGGGIRGVFGRAGEPLASEPTPSGDDASTPTPTPDPLVSTCTAELTLSKSGNVSFTCRMDERIKNITEIDSLTLSISPELPDYHVVMLRFPAQRSTRFFCGPGGCRGFGGHGNYLYPYADYSDTLPDQWTSEAELRRWLSGEFNGKASYHQLKGDATRPGPWALRSPAAPWSGQVQITIVGKQPDE